MSLTLAMAVWAGRKSASDGGSASKSKPAAGRSSIRKKSRRRRATSVRPTRCCGEQTMKSGVRFAAPLRITKRASLFSRGEFRQLHPVVFAPDIAQPVADIAAQHEGIIRGLAAPILVGDKGEEGN